MAEDEHRIQFDADTLERSKSTENANGATTYKKRASVRDADAESFVSEKGAVREGDFKKRQVCGPFTLVMS